MRFLRTNILLLVFIISVSNIHAEYTTAPISWGQWLENGVDACSINPPRLLLNSINYVHSELQINPWRVISISLAAGLACNYGYKIVEKWWNKQCQLRCNIILTITSHCELYSKGYGPVQSEINQVKQWAHSCRTLFLRKNNRLIQAITGFYSATTKEKRSKKCKKILNYASGKFKK